MSACRPLISSRVGRVLWVAVAAGVAAGCATRRGGTPVATTKPAEEKTLAEVWPAVPVPAVPCVPDEPPSTEALQAYANGRDALLRDQPADAITHLERAAELAPRSALVWRDLGYARTGRDDKAAAVAFRRAAAADPSDADARLQLARLLIAAGQRDEAAEQLRDARRAEGFADDRGLAAVVDLLLGQHLERTHHRTAALECYEHVLILLDTKDPALRGRPELADVLQRPGVLALRVADLATQAGQYPRAIELYRRLQRQEPQSAGMLELRLARAELAEGDRVSAAKRAFGFVKTDGNSVLSWALFDELYAPHGGAAAALKDLNRLSETDAAALRLLRSHLLLQSGDTAAAVDAVNAVGRDRAGRPVADEVTLPLARQVVHAYRAAGRQGALPLELLRRTSEAPGRWGVWSRAWKMLTQSAQPDPLTSDELRRVDVAREGPLVWTAQEYVLADLYDNEGRTKMAKRIRDDLRGPNYRTPFDLAAADASPAVDVPGAAVGSSKELGVLLDAYRDDPELLGGVVADALRAGLKRDVAEAFAGVAAARPSDAALAVLYAQLLAAGEQRGDAVAVLDRTAGLVKSARELYTIASQYTAFDDQKTAERLLRKAHAADPNLPSVCNDLGYLLTDEGRELAFAEQLLSRAAAAEPDNTAYLDSLGWLLYKRGKFEDSAKRLVEAVEAGDPADPVVLDHAGDALYRVNKSSAATDRWQQAVEAIKARGASDPQLRLRIEQKLRQAKDKTPVGVAPVAKAE